MNNQNLKPFKKGYDPRRNLRGVPKDSLAGRKAVRKIGAELIHIKEKVHDADGQPTDVEYDLTRYQAMIRLMYTSKDPRDRQMIIKMLHPGLLKDNLDLTTNGKDLPSATTVIYLPDNGRDPHD